MTRRLLGRPKLVNCILCEKIINKEDKIYQIPIEWVRMNDITFTLPVNIMVHRSCYKKSSKKAIKTALNKHITTLM